MALKTKVNKSEEIRKVLASGVTDQKTVVETLAKRGIKVSPAAVYTIKNKLGKSKKRKKAKRAHSNTATITNNGDTFNSVVTFVRTVGGIQVARDLLAELADLKS